MHASYSQPYSAERDTLVGDEGNAVDNCDAEGEERNVQARSHHQAAPPRFLCQGASRYC